MTEASKETMGDVEDTPALVKDEPVAPAAATNFWWVAGIVLAVLVGLYLLHAWMVKKSRASASCSRREDGRQSSSNEAVDAPAHAAPASHSRLDQVKARMNEIRGFAPSASP